MASPHTARQRLLAARKIKLVEYLRLFSADHPVVQQECWMLIHAYHGGPWRALAALLRRELWWLWCSFRMGPLHAIGWHYREGGVCLVCEQEQVGACADDGCHLIDEQGPDDA